MNREFTKRISTNRNTALISLVVILSAGSLIYWLGIRPSNIRSDCHTKSLKASGITKGSDLLQEGYSRTYNLYNELCLDKAGL